MIPGFEPPALYLEGRYDRTVALRIIARRLRHQLYETRDPIQVARLRRRIVRVDTHLSTITREIP